jgi:hypothetical protein
MVEIWEKFRTAYRVGMIMERFSRHPNASALNAGEARRWLAGLVVGVELITATSISDRADLV